MKARCPACTPLCDPRSPGQSRHWQFAPLAHASTRGFLAREAEVWGLLARKRSRGFHTRLAGVLTPRRQGLSRPATLNTKPENGIRGRRHWRPPLNRATPWVAASAMALALAMGRKPMPPTRPGVSIIGPLFFHRAARDLVGRLTRQCARFAAIPHAMACFGAPARDTWAARGEHH